MSEMPTAELPVAAPQTRSCSYVFEREILIVEDVISWGAKLIETCERVNRWQRATLAGHGPAGPGGPAVDLEYHNDTRNNDAVNIDGKSEPAFKDYEFWLSQAFHSCVHAYKALNKHLFVTKDTYVSVLRYGVGQHFHEHVDIITGHASWGARMLSAVAFLNDDFEGGQLAFPRQGVLVTPKAGTLILFPSTFTHPHASLDVTKGTKYSAVTWFV